MTPVRAAALLLLLAGSFPLRPLSAQAGGTVTGMVTDSTGTPVTGVHVSAPAIGTSSVTDDRGEFRLVALPAGRLEIRARRLGYAPETRAVDVPARGSAPSVRIQMALLPTVLREVEVVTRRSDHVSQRLAGYYERLERRSNGQFITRLDLERQEHLSLSAVVGRAPGVRAVPMRSGGTTVRMRGRGCRPLVWIDGTAMPVAEVDLDAFPVSSLHGVELYLSGTDSPVNYTGMRGQSSCGTIMLWSRGRDTEPPRIPPRRVALEPMISTSRLYTVDQVDRPAELDSGFVLDVVYPPDLYAAHFSGSVVTEFVVDTTGRIAPGTVAIVSSTHPFFSAAALQALRNAVFVPATKDGRPVPQVVQQPFGFNRGSRAVLTK